MGQTAVLLTRQVSPQVTCSSGSPWDTDAPGVTEHEHVDPEELAENEQVVSQAVTDANLSKRFRMHNERSGETVHRS